MEWKCIGNCLTKASGNVERRAILSDGVCSTDDLCQIEIVLDRMVGPIWGKIKLGENQSSGKIHV